VREREYEIEIKRRRGRWVAYAPDLPADSPRVELEKLNNVDIQMIVEIAAYLGVNPALVAVKSAHPTRPPRVPLWQRSPLGFAQLVGGAVALGGLYTAAGVAATLIAAGISVVAVAAGKEAGWL